MSTATLPELSALLPPSTPAQIDAVFGSVDPNRFAEVGRRIATERVLTDARRMTGLAWESWKTATPEQKEVLVGFSETLLSVAVHTALALETKNAAFGAVRQQDQIQREATAAELGDVWTTAMRRRDRAARALAPIAGRDPARLAELSGATGTAEVPEALARGLELLAALARKWTADPTLAEIVRITRIDAAWVTSLETAATTLRAAAVAQTTRTTAKVDQGELDVLDGRTLYVLKLVADLFDEAHEEDPTLPRIVWRAAAREFENRSRSRASGGTAGGGAGGGAGSAGERWNDAEGRLVDPAAPAFG